MSYGNLNQPTRQDRPRGPNFYSAASAAPVSRRSIGDVAKYDNTSFLQFGSGGVPFISFTRPLYQRAVRDLPC